MGPRDVFTRDGTTCTYAYPDLALFNAACSSFIPASTSILSDEERKYLTPPLLSPSHAYTLHAHDEKMQTLNK